MSQVLGPSSTPSALEGNRSVTDACRALPATNRVQAAKFCAGITVSAIGFDFRATFPSTRLSRENNVRLVLPTASTFTPVVYFKAHVAVLPILADRDKNKNNSPLTKDMPHRMPL